MSSEEICHVNDTYFHNIIGVGDDHPYEKNRYWIFSSKLCPFAQRVEIVRKYFDLTDEIGMTIASPVQTEHGWNIVDRYLSVDSQECKLTNVSNVPDIYNISKPGYSGRCSVPLLFDTENNIIVNNESIEIVSQLDSIAVKYYDSKTLFPSEYSVLILALLDLLMNEFIPPIYEAGFAQDQETYQENYNMVFATIRTLDEHLSGSRKFFVSDEITVVDVIAFPHLARFDSVFHSLYRLNSNYLNHYPNICEYMERLSLVKGFAETLDIQALKKGYFLSWNQPTNGHFVPNGPSVNDSTGIAL